MPRGTAVKAAYDCGFHEMSIAFGFRNDDSGYLTGRSPHPKSTSVHSVPVNVTPEAQVSAYTYMSIADIECDHVRTSGS